MKVFQAFQKGVTLTNRSKRVIFWLFFFNFLIALTPALVVSGSIEKSLGQSLMAEKMGQGYEDIWYQEFQVDATGLAATFHPTMVGVGAILNGLDDFLSGRLFDKFPGVIALALGYLILWTFVAGGILDLFKEGGPSSLQRFLGASGLYFGRFLRLAVLVGVGYWLVFRYLLPGLDNLIETFTRNSIDERVVFFWTLAKYLVILGVLIELNLISDYAKIATVLEKRSSMILAIVRSFRLQIHHPGRIVGLYFLVGLVGLGFLLLYSLIAPGALQQTWFSVILAFLLGQLYIVSRIWSRMLFYGSQWELCRWLLAQEVSQTSEPPAVEGPAATETV